MTPWTAAHQPSLSINKFWSLLKFMFIESVMPSNHFILCHSLLLPPSIFSSINIFSNESVLRIRWPKFGASASVLPMNIQDWFPLGWTGWISLQSKELSRVFSNTTIQKYQFFGIQLFLWSNSHIYTWLLTTGKNHSFVGKLMSMIFNMLSRFAIAFLPRSKHLLISCLQSPSVVILEPRAWV